MLFWILVIVSGVIGAIADVVLNRWATTHELHLLPWIEAAVLILVFATVFGLAMRLGERAKYPLSAAVLLVLVINIGMVVVIDVWMNGVSFTPVQWAGFTFGLLAFICWELG